MKIADWNVFNYNPFIENGLKYIFSLDPDVICLQELPHKYLRFIQESGYYISYTEDFHAKKIRHSGYICTATKVKPIGNAIKSYYNKDTETFLNKFFYKKFNGASEFHNSVETEIVVDSKPVSVFNARLSCATSPSERIVQLKNLLSQRSDNKHTIFCGDFNISSSHMFALLTGWARGYTKNDYNVNERVLANEAISDHSLKNIFNGIRTSVMPINKFQLDHILLPLSEKVISKRVIPKSFFSDHFILFVETK